MPSFRRSLISIILTLSVQAISGGYPIRQAGQCGPYGFICENARKLRLCDGTNLFGPTFNCPANTICSEDSSDVCEDAINHFESSVTKSIRCRRNERLADPSVPGCKGYILCIPNKNRFQGIKFKCSGSTVFNGVTRTCSDPDKYKCPLSNSTTTTFTGNNRRHDVSQEDVELDDWSSPVKKLRPIDCKNYKFRVTQNSMGRPARATYFCPSRPPPGERATRCTVFSNQFCITLERDDEDQFALEAGIAYRKPRLDLHI
ncbi:unnamed protein product [Plutella xylostella]|uniref:(diamondback moth) hypothetical protein n=1 Tax=Plutella xylostella TaxID=51655 RepID=A0A8S4D6Z5_PLUXY|nr:unnamed protein product [Plutella xylostella]